MPAAIDTLLFFRVANIEPSERSRRSVLQAKRSLRGVDCPAASDECLRHSNQSGELTSISKVNT